MDKKRLRINPSLTRWCAYSELKKNKQLSTRAGKMLKRIGRVTGRKKARTLSSKATSPFGSTKMSKRSKKWGGRPWSPKKTTIQKSMCSSPCWGKTTSINGSKRTRCPLPWLPSLVEGSLRTSCWWPTFWSKMLRMCNQTAQSNKVLWNIVLQSGVKRAHTCWSTSRINACRASVTRTRSWSSSAAMHLSHKTRCTSSRRASLATPPSASNARWSTIKWYLTVTHLYSSAICAVIPWLYTRRRIRTRRTKRLTLARFNCISTILRTSQACPESTRMTTRPLLFRSLKPWTLATSCPRPAMFRSSPSRKASNPTFQTLRNWRRSTSRAL